MYLWLKSENRLPVRCKRQYIGTESDDNDTEDDDKNNK
jgi:hypothetical protein